MDKSAAGLAITECLKEIRCRLRHASATGEAALTSAEKGNIPQAIDTALDIEQPLYEASRLLDAASLMARVGLGSG
jgi:hypothetical protein